MSPSPNTYARFAHKWDEISLALHGWNRNENAPKQDVCRGLVYSLRIRLIDALLKSEETCRRQGAKSVVPFAFLNRPSMRNNLFNSGLLGQSNAHYQPVGH
jgi:hypothetical protein